MKPLSRVRVIELGLWVAGPAAAGILADWGAEVIKVEMPTGDPMRRLFGELSGSKETRCPPFDLYNRGKLSIAIDVNTIEGLEAVRRLILTADVFITNMRPQFLERSGLDSKSLLSLQPGLVYASLTAYGAQGPDRDAPGFDMAAFSGRTGLADRATPAGSPPPILPGGIGDNVSAMSIVAGICAALFHRARTGQGQVVSTSLMRNGIYSIGMDVSTRLGLGRMAPPWPRTRPPNPLMNLYRASDDRWFWLVGAESERHWPVILNAIGMESLGDDPDFATPRDRRRNASRLVECLDAIFATRGRDEWAQEFAAHDVWWAPVQSVEELLTDPQAEACGAFVSVPGAEDAARSVATPVDFSLTPVGPSGPSPGIGADSDRLLDSIGIGAEQRMSMRARGILPESAEVQDGR